MDVAGKNIVITGGGRGMGKQFAVDLKALGGKPYVVDVVQENLDELKNETGIEGEVLDVTNEDAVVDFFERYTAKNSAPERRVFMRQRSGCSDDEKRSKGRNN